MYEELSQDFNDGMQVASAPGGQPQIPHRIQQRQQTTKITHAVLVIAYFRGFGTMATCPSLHVVSAFGNASIVPS
jgi:hypothetical protein